MAPRLPQIAAVVSAARRRYGAQALAQAAVRWAPLALGAIVLAIVLAKRGPLPISWAFAVGAAGTVAWLLTSLRALRRLPSAESLARRLDAAAGLADRMGNAVALVQTPSGTPELAEAAIADGEAAAVKADIVTALPWQRPSGIGPVVLLGAVMVAVIALDLDQRSQPTNLGATVKVPPPKDTFVPTPDDAQEIKDQIEKLRAAGEQQRVPAFTDAANKLDELLAKATRGELSKAELLLEAEKVLSALAASTDAADAEAQKALEQLGRDLRSNPATAELGKALNAGDLAKAAAELQKLSEQVANGTMTPEQAQTLGAAIDQAIDNAEARDQAAADKAAAEKAATEQQIAEAAQTAADPKATPEQKQAAEERLAKAKADKERQSQHEQDQEQSAQKRELKKMQDQLRQAADDLQAKDESAQKQAAQKMKYAADSAGEIDKDQRRIAEQKRQASQMEDLREALRRAKQNKAQGQGNDPFGQQGQKEDFGKRAAGGQGSKEAWRGQGQKSPGQGAGQPGDGDPNGQPGDGPGTEPGGDLRGDATPMANNVKDEKAQSAAQGQGPSRRQTILSAAQKGFASAAYKKVFAEYKNNAEEVVRSEKVPSAYKYLVRRYFSNIRPRDNETSEPPPLNPPNNSTGAP